MLSRTPRKPLNDIRIEKEKYIWRRLYRDEHRGKKNETFKTSSNARCHIRTHFHTPIYSNQESKHSAQWFNAPWNWMWQRNVRWFCCKNQFLGERELIETNWRRLRGNTGKKQLTGRNQSFCSFFFFLFCFFCFERKLFIFFLSLCCFCCCHTKRQQQTEDGTSTFHLSFSFFVQDGFQNKQTNRLCFLSLSYSITLSDEKMVFLLFVTWISFHFPIRSLWSYEPAQW